MSLAQSIRSTAAAVPEKEALVFGGERLSYSDLDLGSDAMAYFLSGLDLKIGDRVGILMPNCTDNVLVFLAVLKIGGIEVNINPDMPTNTIIQAFKQAEITVLVGAKTPVEKMRSIIRACPEIRHVILEGRLLEEIGSPDLVALEDMHRKQAAPYPAVSIDTDPALIQYTSGTTGQPKGVTLSQGSFISASKARQQALELDETARILNILRLSHSCSKSLLFDALITGATLVLAKGFVPPSGFLKTLREENISLITGPPFLFHQLLKLRNRKDVVNRLRSSLKYLEIGMAGAPPGLFHELRAAFPWASIINRYGVTENAGAASMMIHGPGDAMIGVGACGRSAPGAPMEISRADRTDTSADGLSEVRIKGPAVMIGYWEDLKRGHAPVYQKTGFDTGDLVDIDAEGRLFIAGRKDDMIQVAGERVAPKTIEDVVLQLHGIREAVVLGIEDKIFGHRIALCYYSDGINCDETVLEHCRKHLPPYMVPHVLTACRQALPKNAAGKISRQALRKQVQRGTLTAGLLQGDPVDTRN